MSQVKKSRVKTRVKNDSSKPLQLKEGTGGVYRNLTLLEAGKEYTITCNTSATYREYWVGVRPDSTQSQANSTQSQANPTQSQANDNVTITSDDCIAYERIRIHDSKDTPPGLEVARESPRDPNATILTNRSKGAVNLKITEKTRENETVREKVLQPDQCLAIPVGTKHCLEHSVNNVAGGATLKIDNEVAARSQAVNILDAPGEASELKVEMEGTRETKTGIWSKMKGLFSW